MLDRMQAMADKARHEPDVKTRRLIGWSRERMCPGLPPFGGQPGGSPPRWNDRRVLIFTENREGTKRYLKAILDQAIEGSDRADERIEVIDGLTRDARRKETQRRFNADPATDPLRILLATDAAREGLSFQAHCADLFHFDLPWNPGRIRAQGFVYHDLSRACLAQAKDSIPRVILLGRLCFHARNGSMRRSSRWPIGGSNQRSGTDPSRPTCAKPRRERSTC